MKKRNWISLLALTAMLGGCSSNNPAEPVLPESKVSMKEVYEGAIYSEAKASNLVLKRPATDTERSIDPYILHNTKRTHFKKLDNPTMYLFVNTHLSTASRVPVPAYLTEFKLLERDEYAMPGQINLSNWR